MVIRALLAQPTQAEAVAFCLEVPHASGQNYTIGGPDGSVTMVEGSADGAATVAAAAPGEQLKWLAHANHPLSWDRTKVSANSLAREETACQVVAGGADAAAAAGMNGAVRLAKAVLADQSDWENPICRHPAGGGAMSLGGVVFVSTGAGGAGAEMWCAAGPMDVNPSVCYGFE